MMFRIGIDVGGTFTDYVAFRDSHDSVSGKTRSTPGREGDAVIEALRRVANGFAVSTEELLADTNVINFGTTVATNAMLEHKGARVGMLTTKEAPLENEKLIETRLEEATKYKSLDDLALSTQCGFASAANAPMTTEEQRAKLDLVANVAHHTWG